MRRPRRLARPRVIAAIGICVLVAAPLVALRLYHASKPSTSDLLRLASGITYPAGSEVCSGVMTPACAHEAAVRAGHPIAWLATPTGFTADGTHLLSVKGARGISLFTEILHTNSVIADLQLGQIGNDAGAPDGTAPVAGATATISHLFDLGGAGGGMFDYYASWMVEGRAARLTVSSGKLWGATPQSTRRTLLDLLVKVELSAPSPS